MSTEKSLKASQLLKIGLFALWFGLSLRAWAANPTAFAGDDAMLDRSELIRFLLVEKGATYADIDKEEVTLDDIEKAGGDIQSAKEARYLLIELDKANKEFGQGPYRPSDAVAIAQDAPANASQEKSDSNRLDGILYFPKPRQPDNGQFQRGPILLRKQLVDWQESVQKVSGVSLNFNRDRETDKDTWLSQGTMIYPFKREVQRNAREVDRGEGLYDYWALLPSVVWNYNQVNNEGDGDIDELRFQLPVTRRILHSVQPRATRGLQSWMTDLYVTPFYQTDFDFKGAIFGVQLDLNPYLVFGALGEHGQGFKPAIGSFVGITRENPVEYRIRVIPGLHFSQVSQESQFIVRERNDDLTAVTADTELGFRLKGSKTWLLTFGYSLLYDFNTGDYDEAYRDLWSGELSWWFTDNTGLGLEFQQGTQPITLQEVDTINLGLQIRF